MGTAFVLSVQTGMRENPALLDGFGDFDRYEGYAAYSDLVEAGSIFLVQGNAEVKN
jgi:hypothetical protein